MPDEAAVLEKLTAEMNDIAGKLRDNCDTTERLVLPRRFRYLLKEAETLANKDVSSWRYAPIKHRSP
jgi:hypothetical protein